MTKAARFFYTVGALLLVQSCATTEDPSPESTGPDSSTATDTLVPVSPSLTPGGPTNSRGALEKVWGQPAGMGCDDQAQCDVNFVLDAPGDATDCLESLPAENGSLKAFPVGIETGSTFDPPAYGTILQSFDFVAITSSGLTVTSVSTDASINCQESNSLPTTFSKGSKYEGFVVLDLPADAASIAYVPSNSDGGWEWSLGPGR
ncbi:hypothetical protein [Rhodococcoides fascians]|uniref:hypothetical protein n=1 Tax=Rhodococcoides fascians TaxID=1828 RepID=UPI0037A3CD5B